MSNKREATFHGAEPERETIGDWAGHTPQAASTDTLETFEFTLEQRASNVITQQLFGLSPYIIIKPELGDDNENVILHIEAGGGAELDGLGALFEGVGKLLQEPEAVQQIDAALAAAKEAAEQDDDEDED